MGDPPFTTHPDDDLPRTLKRERDARRAQQAANGYAHGSELPPGPPGAGPGVTVTAFDVPFGKMVAFFMKAVFAAIPALLLLGVMLFLFGQALQKFLPWLVKMRIIISFPG